MKKIDLLVKNGHVIDTFRGIDEICNIGIVGNQIVELTGEEIPNQVINADGCYVVPGLIDYHVHSFFGGTKGGMHPDFMLPVGITSIVDQGSSGYADFESYYRIIATNSFVRSKAYLAVSPTGLIIPGLAEESYEPEYINETKITSLVKKYRDYILGLKVKISNGYHDYDGYGGIDALKRTVCLAEKIGGLRVYVHVVNPPCSIDEIVDTLRPGDIFGHMYQGEADTILNEDGTIKESVKLARERGVLFDEANGRLNYDLEVCQKALKQGFLPDIISSDMSLLINKNYAGRYVRSFPYIMSKFLELGMSLNEIIRLTTQAPAFYMGMEGAIGTLKPGAFADVAIFKLADIEHTQLDAHDRPLRCKKLLIPQMTIHDGMIAYAAIDFDL